MRLLALGRINAGKPDPVLSLTGVQDGQRVPVGDLDDLAQESLGASAADEQDKEESRSTAWPANLL